MKKVIYMDNMKIINYVIKAVLQKWLIIKIMIINVQTKIVVIMNNIENIKLIMNIFVFQNLKHA